jgi:predicted nucleic acid-binding protein
LTFRVFLDTNVILDLLGERVGFFEPAARIASLADMKAIQLFVSTLSLTTVHYFVSKTDGKMASVEKLRAFRLLTSVADASGSVVDKTLLSRFGDFEDAVQHFCAVEAGCTHFVTRNTSDFKHSEIPDFTPEAFLTIYQMTKSV